MSFQANLSDAPLAAALLTRDRRPAVAEQAVSPDRRDNAWQREMERAQAGAWFPGALPEGEGLFRSRPDVQPVHPAPPPAQRQAVAHAVHATQVWKPDTAPRRAGERDHRADVDGTALRRQERAPDEIPVQASPHVVVRASDDFAPPAHEGSEKARVAAAAFVASAAKGPSVPDADVEPASPKLAAAPLGSLAVSGAPGLPVPSVMAALPSPSAAVQAAGPVPAAALSPHAADSAALPSSTPAASPAQPAGPAPRADAGLPLAFAGAVAASQPAAAENAAPMAQEGSGMSGPASGVRSLMSIERVLNATLGGAPGPRLHLSWDGQAVAVWIGVDGAIDSTALLRTVQNVLRQQGLQLSSLICNGRTIVLPRPAQGQPSNSEQQEH